jgi:hypothetical protein
LSDWLALRTPRPPAELSTRLEHLIGDIECEVAEIPASLIRAATGVLSNIGDDRSAATDLLAADALITYAMEAAAESASVDTVAATAMKEIAATVTGSTT